MIYKCIGRDMMEKADLKILQQKVTLLRSEGKYTETIEEGYNLLNLGLQLNDYKSILTAHINNSASFYCIGAIEDAFKSIEAYEEVCSQYGDEVDFLSLFNVLFLLYEYNKDYIKAKETLSKSIELGMKINKYNIVSNGLSNFSHVYLMEGKFEHALELAKKGLEMAKMHTPASRILEIRVSLNIAQAYIGLGNLTESKIIIDEIINDPILESFIREKSQSYILQGNWLSKNNLFMKAFESFTYAKELVESYRDLYLLKTIQEERNKLCEEMNDIQLGYQVQKEYISLLNEISNHELALTALKLEMKHKLSDIVKKANTDFLTGLYNRNFIEITTNEWLKEASNSDEHIVCIVFDIDNFKTINDENGHLFGDEVIKKVGEACSAIIGENELIGRYGGDEFVIILKDSSTEKGIKKAKHVKNAIKNINILKDGKVLSLTSSMGVAENSFKTDLSFTELFHRADQYLYIAKRNGKNQIITAKSNV